MNEYVTWYNLVFIVLALGVVIYGISMGKAKEWLKWAVCVAEEEFGGGTGQLKLHKVYDMFIDAFPVLASILPFNIFSKLVDVALEWMKEQLDKNEAIKLIIEG